MLVFQNVLRMPVVILKALTVHALIIYACAQSFWCSQTTALSVIQPAQCVVLSAFDFPKQVAIADCKCRHRQVASAASESSLHIMLRYQLRYHDSYWNLNHNTDDLTNALFCCTAAEPHRTSAKYCSAANMSPKV
ncbi:hypothetical protein A0H81_10237 [Grifola frondosa]|uniref:Uncharacterized protein n=1 Tax=Grifola frondosa TaxID=5627 RepID=A0A1C7LYV9_GRIFR|nr:hypothetical protein A0H81_10237 [Grifola frondosa]